MYLRCTQGTGGEALDQPRLQILRRILLFSLCPWPCPGESASRRPLSALRPPGRPGAQYFEIFSTFFDFHAQGPTVPGRARGRAPPGGHSRYCSPLDALELSTLNFFSNFSDFFHFHTQGPTVPCPCPGESASRRPLSALQPPGRPGAQYFATFSNFSDFFHFHTQGPTVPCPARGRAPPGGHSRHCSPRDALEPTAQYFATFPNFSDFFHFHTQGPTVPCPPC